MLFFFCLVRGIFVQSVQEVTSLSCTSGAKVENVSSCSNMSLDVKRRRFVFCKVRGTFIHSVHEIIHWMGANSIIFRLDSSDALVSMYFQSALTRIRAEQVKEESPVSVYVILENVLWSVLSNSKGTSLVTFSWGQWLAVCVKGFG